jgi:hypothetical protein
MFDRNDRILIVLMIVLGMLASMAVAIHMDTVSAKDVVRMINEKIMHRCDYEIVKHVA